VIFLVKIIGIVHYGPEFVVIFTIFVRLGLEIYIITYSEVGIKFLAFIVYRFLVYYVKYLVFFNFLMTCFKLFIYFCFGFFLVEDIAF